MVIRGATSTSALNPRDNDPAFFLLLLLLFLCSRRIFGVAQAKVDITIAEQYRCRLARKEKKLFYSAVERKKWKHAR